MRIIESFGGWNSLRLDESTKAAKEYMFQRAAKKMRKMPEDLTPEERDRILEDPTYRQVAELAKSYPNYITALLKFAFEHDVTVDQISSLLNDFQTKKALIAQIGSPQQILDDYANREVENGVHGFEQLTDEIMRLERVKEAKWFIDAVPKRLRDGLRSLNREQMEPVINAIVALEELGEEPIKRFFASIKALENEFSTSEFVDYFINYVAGYSDENKRQRLEAIDEYGPQAGILYYDGQYLAVSLRTAEAQRVVCSGAQWCINRGSFDSSSYGGGNNQISVFNFNADQNSDPMFMVGFTISYSGKEVKYTQNYNNRDIKASSDPAENFRKLGYPEDLIKTVVKVLPEEGLIKQAVYNLGIDSSTPEEVLFKVIQQSYDVTEFSPENKQILVDIVVDKIKSKLNIERVAAKYKEYGILSKFSAEIAKDILKDAPASVMQDLANTTLEIFAEINSIVQADPSLANDRIRNVLSQEDAVLTELGLNRGDVEALMEYTDWDSLDEFMMAEPAVKPRTAPTIAPTRPMPKRPGPVPSKQPFKAPEPAKAEAEDVIARYEELTKNQEEE
jgi:hypothetical protein